MNARGPKGPKNAPENAPEDAGAKDEFANDGATIVDPMPSAMIADLLRDKPKVALARVALVPTARPIIREPQPDEVVFSEEDAAAAFDELPTRIKTATTIMALDSLDAAKVSAAVAPAPEPAVLPVQDIVPAVTPRWRQSVTGPVSIPREAAPVDLGRSAGATPATFVWLTVLVAVVVGAGAGAWFAGTLDAFLP